MKLNHIITAMRLPETEFVGEYNGSPLVVAKRGWWEEVGTTLVSGGVHKGKFGRFSSYASINGNSVPVCTPSNLTIVFAKELFEQIKDKVKLI